VFLDLFISGGGEGREDVMDAFLGITNGFGTIFVIMEEIYSSM
jgi:hypothetical protein